MTDLELLRGIRELIAQREHWNRGSYGLDAQGRDVDLSNATCFCLSGAGAKVLGLDGPDSCFEDRLSLALDVPEVIHWNDTHTHAEVLALLDRRIAELEAA